MKTKCLKRDDECQLSNLYYNDVILNARIRTSHNSIEYIKGTTWKYKQLLKEFILYTRLQIKHAFNNTKLGKHLELQRYIKTEKEKNVRLLNALKHSEAESNQLAQDIIRTFKIDVENEEHTKILNKVLLVSETAPKEYDIRTNIEDYIKPTLFIECSKQEAIRAQKAKEDHLAYELKHAEKGKIVIPAPAPSTSYNYDNTAELVCLASVVNTANLVNMSHTI